MNASHEPTIPTQATTPDDVQHGHRATLNFDDDLTQQQGLLDLDHEVNFSDECFRELVECVDAIVRSRMNWTASSKLRPICCVVRRPTVISCA